MRAMKKALCCNQMTMRLTIEENKTPKIKLPNRKVKM
jgi:hypothetical protein